MALIHRLARLEYSRRHDPALCSHCGKSADWRGTGQLPFDVVLVKTGAGPQRRQWSEHCPDCGELRRLYLRCDDSQALLAAYNAQSGGGGRRP